MELNAWIEDELDQTGTDRIVSALKVTEIIEQAMVLSRTEAEAYTEQLGDKVDFDDTDTESALATIELKDLYASGVAPNQRQVYYFRPLLPLALNLARTVLVDDVVWPPSEYTYDATTCKVTFDAQLSPATVTVKVTGYIVDMTKALDKTFEAIERKILTSPDLYGSQRMSWLENMRKYRNREFRSASG
jgi:hypothetical protein